MKELIVNKNDRDMAADTVRVVAMFFVICVHVSFAGYTDAAVNSCMALYFLCNGMFFMLSGKFNLKFKGETGADYRKYYLKKLVTIGIPFLLYGGLITLYSQWGNGIKVLVKAYIRGMFDGSVSEHLWFMFPLVGMLVAAPFLSKLVAALNDTEKKILILVALVWEGTRALFVRDILGTEFEYAGWFLDSWPVYFVLGAVLDDIIKTEKGKKRLMLAGGICLILTILQKTFLPEHAYNIFDRSPLYIMATVGGYEAISRAGKKIKGPLAMGVRFLAKHSFSVYFVHYSVIAGIGKHYRLELGALGNRVVIVLAAFVISVLLATVIDTLVINPVTSLIKKKI